LWPLVSLSVALAVASRFFPVLWPLAFLAIGLAWAQVHACRMLCEPFPERYTRQDLVVEGSIASLPEETGGAMRFLFRVDNARREGLDIGFTGLVRLAWYVDPPDLCPGERWRLSVRLKPPHGFANPGGFAYERWLFLQGIRATGSVRDKGAHERLEDGPGRYLIDRWRQRLQDHISERLCSRYLRMFPHAPMARASSDAGGAPRWALRSRARNQPR
jgi:competence protein ComEC